jgi:hypothetical protein
MDPVKCSREVSHVQENCQLLENEGIKVSPPQFLSNLSH